MRTRLPVVSAIVLLCLAAASAAAVAQVSDREFERPPYYTGKKPAADASLGHFAVAYQPGATHAPLFDPSGAPDSPIAALLEEMNAYLDGLGVTTRLEPASPAPSSPPDVSFGCDADPSGECVERDDGEALGRAGTRMRLAVVGPSRGWRAWAAGTLQEAGLEGAISLTLEVGQYWVRQRGLRGDKVVQLGSDHQAELAWLTSLETPVTVLQLTGALVDRNGRVVRIGAEGLMARRTAFRLSVVGAQELVTDEDVERIRESRREDLSGTPLVWQEALDRLVEELTGRMVARGGAPPTAALEDGIPVTSWSLVAVPLSR